VKKSKPRSEDPGEGGLDAAGLRQLALNLLARREHSVLELGRKLATRGAERELIDTLLDQLQHERLLSDARFAEAYVRMRTERGFGPLRIRAELRERGVDEGLITAELDGGSSHWSTQAEAARRKRFGARLPRDWSERARQARFLEYRGFSAGTIGAVLRDTVDD
jgi:regulatory protein